MKFVLDTNVLIAALIWGGKPYDILKLCTQTPHEVWTSPLLLAELHRTLGYTKLKPYLDARRLTQQQLFDQLVLILHPSMDIPLKSRVCRDPDDDVVLACAVSARADYIVSGDKDLLVLNEFEGTPILSVAQTLELLQIT